MQGATAPWLLLPVPGALVGSPTATAAARARATERAAAASTASTASTATSAGARRGDHDLRQHHPLRPGLAAVLAGESILGHARRQGRRRQDDVSRVTRRLALALPAGRVATEPRGVRNHEA